MKKKMRIILALSVILLFLTACGQEEDDEKITLNMAWWGSQVRHDATVKVIELYEEKNPHVTIEYEFYDYEGY